jgi:hypothetical protein
MVASVALDSAPPLTRKYLLACVSVGQRDIGHLRSKQVALQRSMRSAKEISEELKKHQEEREQHVKEANVKETSQIAGHTSGNLYTTTLHVINSAVLKLGQLTKAEKVYRGISYRTLPERMLKRDRFNTCGGVEYGFTSCSTNKDEAEMYATSANERNTTDIVVEMEMGMVDRGAVPCCKRMNTTLSASTRPQASAKPTERVLRLPWSVCRTSCGSRSIPMRRRSSFRR